MVILFAGKPKNHAHPTNNSFKISLDILFSLELILAGNKDWRKSSWKYKLFHEDISLLKLKILNKNFSVCERANWKGDRIKAQFSNSLLMTHYSNNYPN